MSQDNSKLNTLSAAQTATAVNSGDIRALEVAYASLEAVERLNPTVNAFTDVLGERALLEARAIDDAIAEGRTLPLAGVPYAVKNLYDVEGLTTRAGAKINRENPPASADATLVRKLKDAGAVLVGATHMGEYAYARVANAFAMKRDGKIWCMVFQDLHERFALYVDVFAEISERAALTDAEGIVRLYEKWLVTGNEHLARRLAAQGVLPGTPTSGGSAE